MVRRSRLMPAFTISQSFFATVSGAEIGPNTPRHIGAPPRLIVMISRRTLATAQTFSVNSPLA